MTAANATDPRDYSIIRALGALSLATPDIELARAFLREAGAGERIHQAAQVQRCYQALSDHKFIERLSAQTVAVTFPNFRLATDFELLAKEAKELQP